MIAIKLKGGIGNQLFQYAFGRFLAEKNGAPLLLDISSYKSDAFGRSYRLSFFPIRAQVTDGEKIQRPQRILQRIQFAVQSSLSSLRPCKTIKEKNLSFHPALLKLRGNMVLQGYWQDERYFKAAAPLLLSELSLKPEHVNRIDAELLKAIRGSHSVGLHVRRSDYVNNKTVFDKQGVCSIDYYNQSLDVMRAKAANIIVFVFSDDIAWCREKFRFPEKTFFVTGNQDYEDLFMMSQCRHNIIANSTFSWWGAWLNQNPDKIVIAPQVWAAFSPEETKDIVPRTWIKV